MNTVCLLFLLLYSLVPGLSTHPVSVIVVPDHFAELRFPAAFDTTFTRADLR
jgi:hypothetical protein